MYEHKLSRFDQSVLTIHPGEYHVSRDDIIISTVLGSCVSVAFWDRRLQQGGMNHFMLPGDVSDADLVRNPNAKYGMFAIELLYNELMKLGSMKRDLVAKVFGGASVLKLETGPTKVPKGNVDFAQAYLHAEGIPIIANDTGGILPRKIFFFAQTGKVLLKRIAGAMASEVEREEALYLDKIKRAESGKVTLF
ncbi:MAG TPA: chemotaxis protein CheD [Spirochaetales bacterium]|nr:chemotaxis protein CheD [Spirochaetales bacterium]HPM73826.1 chemotaxis protein CheD [Spirochaetales bacterium]HQO65126.1 chemotaxis protein CheD [Spirochaetales bacterium]